MWYSLGDRSEAGHNLRVRGESGERQRSVGAERDVLGGAHPGGRLRGRAATPAGGG